jgi:hypothetical protein
VVSEEGDGSPIVIRFAPFTAQGMMNSARKQYERDLDDGVPPRLGVSVFAQDASAGESVHVILEALCRIALPTGGPKVAMISKNELLATGHTTHEAPPDACHYLMGRPNLSDVPDTVAIADLLKEARYDNPAYEGK